MKLIFYKKDLFILVLFLFSLLNLQCKKNINVEMPLYHEQLVVQSFFNPDSNFRVYLENSISILENSDSIKTIENANVEIYKENLLFDTLRHEGSGMYVTENKKPLIGENYTLKIHVPGFSDVSGEDEIPLPVPFELISLDSISTTIDSFYIAADSFYVYSYTKYNMTFTINDRPNEENYYSLHFLPVISISTTNTAIINEESNDISEDNIFRGNSCIFSDFLFDGERYQISINFKIASYDNFSNIGLNLDAYSKNLFLFKKSFFQRNDSDWDDSPFTEPSQLHSNIENGLGIFAGFSIYSIEIKL